MITLIQYLHWHFFEVPREILRAWKNYLKFNLNYFSTLLLIKTLFSYWRRYSWSYGRGIDIWRYILAFFSNFLSRILGSIMRIFLIVVGVFFEILILVLGPIIFFVWLLLPVYLILSLIFGFQLLS